MSFITFVMGVAVGAAFSPFWITLYQKHIKPWLEKSQNRQ
jgi:hypothetical protein